MGCYIRQKNIRVIRDEGADEDFTEGGCKRVHNGKCNRLDGEDAAELHLLPVGKAVMEAAT